MSAELLRIGVITDAHGNLPALRAALAALSRERVDVLYHAGRDAAGLVAEFDARAVPDRDLIRRAFMPRTHTEG